MKIANLLRELDTMSPTYNLNIDGNDRVKTKMGGLLVLLSVATLLAYAVSSLVDYFKPSKYDKLEVITEDATHAPPLNLFDLKRLPMISVINVKGQHLLASEIQDYMTLVFSLYSRKTQTNYTVRHLPFINCSLALEGYREYFGGHIDKMSADLKEFSSYLCLNSSQVRDAILEGNYDEGIIQNSSEGIRERVYNQAYKQASVHLGPCLTNSCKVTDSQLTGYSYKLAFFEARTN